ncbi:hypothetical protein [Streptomyces sp. GESEQ-35]|uniref:hypothetical protein n=1 Tax=Streptomyces sp. GESEQ-35 TaxID=2812657 RepID=UPI001B321DFB|nr:hypothetical protein [Streptomyces sp. GESEQ-35]
MARILRRLIPVTAVLGVAVLGMPGTASAAETAYNIKVQYLEARPSGGQQSCVQRRISLASGYYDWSQQVGQGERLNVYLGKGDYTWTDCLRPVWGYYSHTTTLEPDNPDWSQINLLDDVTLDASDDYAWGSKLDPRF